MSTNRPAQIFEAMHDLVHVYRARMMEVVASIHPELTHNEVRALMFVGRHPGATQKELVQHASADKAQIDPAVVPPSKASAPLAVTSPATAASASGLQPASAAKSR